MIKAKGGNGDTSYEPCPTGMHPAVCVDVIDLGERETPFEDRDTGKRKIQHQIKIVWQVAAEDEDGVPALRDDGLKHRLAKFYTLSLFEMANLRKDLDRWRGKSFTEVELRDGWDVESVIGASCLLNVVHKASKDRVYANVESVLPLPRKAEKVVPDEYTRERDVPGGKDTRSPEAGSDTRSQDGDDKEEWAGEDLPDLPF